jgi:hypothetical protein
MKKSIFINWTAFFVVFTICNLNQSSYAGGEVLRAEEMTRAKPVLFPRLSETLREGKEKREAKKEAKQEEKKLRSPNIDDLGKNPVRLCPRVRPGKCKPDLIVTHVPHPPPLLIVHVPPTPGVELLRVEVPERPIFQLLVVSVPPTRVIDLIKTNVPTAPGVDLLVVSVPPTRGIDLIKTNVPEAEVHINYIYVERCPPDPCVDYSRKKYVERRAEQSFYEDSGEYSGNNFHHVGYIQPLQMGVPQDPCFNNGGHPDFGQNGGFVQNGGHPDFGQNVGHSVHGGFPYNNSHSGGNYDRAMAIGHNVVGNAYGIGYNTGVNAYDAGRNW